MTRPTPHAIAARSRVLIWTLLVLWTLPQATQAAPDVDGALESLIGGSLRAAGSVVGGTGMIASAGIGLAGDVVSLVDRNPITRPILHGAVSRALQRVALGLSWTTSGLMEGLRAVNIERLPEASATYLLAGPGVGRLDTTLGGLGALRLGISDAVTTIPLALLRVSGVQGLTKRLLQRQVELQVQTLGPTPLAGPAE